jgi:uncharacterized Fe-S cluster-containing MiaB family protein
MSVQTKCTLCGYQAGMKMETVRSSETLVSTYEFTRHYNPEDRSGDITLWERQIPESL